MKKILFYGTVLLAAMSAWIVRRPAQVAAGDGIPDNCEYTRGAYYQPNVFARYEPQNARLMLVDWSSGEDVKVVAEGLGATRILGWSLDCRYLAGAVGSSDSMDTVVWDVTTATMIGKVADAHLKPHTITWGPNDYLMVETRDGAVLWNVPVNTQFHLDTGFNNTTSRNFSRLRWDTAHQQVTANLAVGGRVVYDLTNGQIVPEAANLDANAAKVTAVTSTIGGKEYACRDYYQGFYRADVDLYYDYRAHSVELRLYNAYKRDEVLAVLEANLQASFFHDRGWSPDCRYVAASVGRPESSTSDTVVWDLTTNKRVGAFTDARLIEHPIHWSPDGTMLLVETRDGAYIWHLATDQRVLVSTHVETALTGQQSIRSFVDVGWDIGKGQLLGIAVEHQEDVTAYDVNNGQVVGSYPLSVLDKQPDNSAYNYYKTQYPDAAAPLPTQLPNNPLDGKNGMTRYPNDTYLWYSYVGDFQQCGQLAANYVASSNELVLFDHTTRKTLYVLAEHVNPVADVAWSPGCRYVIAAFSGTSTQASDYDNAPVDDYGGNIIVFWDVQTGKRLTEFQRIAGGTNVRVMWSPSGERALIRTPEGYFIYEPATNTKVLLTYPTNSGAINTWYEAYWDYSRGQLLVTGWNGVIAFDMRTGVGRYSFAADPGEKYSSCGYWGCSMTVENNRTLYVHGLSIYEKESQWDLDTLAYQVEDHSK